LHLPSLSTNLVTTAALHDAMVTTTTPGGQCVSICTCTRTGRHLATFTRRPGSSLYTLATEPSQVAASAQVSASGHPSLPHLRGMHPRLLVSGLPSSLPPLPPSPAPPCLPCVEGRQRAAPHSPSFPPTTAPLQTLHMDVWGPARVSGQSRKRYFLLVLEDYTRYTTVFPLRSKGQVVDVLISWIRTVCLKLRERFGQDLPVLRLHSDRSVMEVAHTSMIHAAAPHFLCLFAVRYAAHQLNIWPRVSLPETSPTLRWTGEVGDASVFRVWGSRAFVRDTSADKLSPRAIPCVFLGFVPDAPGWHFYHPTSRRVFPSQDVTFDESVPYYRLFPYRSAPPPPPPLSLAPGPPPVDPLLPQGHAPSVVSQVDPLLGPAPVQVAIDSGAARGTASGGAKPVGAEPGGAESEGAETGGAEPGGVATRGGVPGGAEPEGVEPGGSAGASPRLSPQQLREWFVRRTRLWTGASGAGGASTAGAGGTGVATGAGVIGGTVMGPMLVEVLVTSVMEVIVVEVIVEVMEVEVVTIVVVEVFEVAIDSGAARGTASGGAKPVGAEPGGAESEGAETGGAEPGGVATRGGVPGGAEPEGVEPGGSAGASPRLSPQQLREWFVRRTRLWTGASGAGGASTAGAGGTGVATGAGVIGGTATTGPGGARTRGIGAAGTGGVAGARAGDLTESGTPGAGGAGAGGAGVGGPSAGGAGVGGPGVGGAGAGGAGAVAPGGTVRPRPYFVPLLQQPASPLPAPSPYTEQSGGLTECREPASRSVSPVRTARRVPRSHPPLVPGTHAMTLCPSSVPLCVPLPAPPESSLPEVPDPESNRARAASPTVSRLLATADTDPSFESAAASALVVELLDFAAACHLDYASALVAESVSASPPSVGGECALGTDVFKDRQEEFKSLAAVVPRFASMLLAPEGDPDAPDIPTPRSYAEAITGPYSSQWQAAMDAEMASLKSTGTYVDEVPPPGANIVDGMWIFRVKRSPGSPPAFKARYVARGFSQRQGVEYFHTFSPTPKMTTLWVLLHVAAQRDYDLHFLDFNTAFLQGSLHEEIWLRRPPGFTESFPAGTQWSLRWPVYDLRQAPREWHDTLRTTLAALGFTPAIAYPSLFLRTDTTLPPFYVLVYVDDLVFAIADIEALTLVKSELQKRHACTDLGELRSYLGLQITRDRARRTITLTQSHMVHQVLQRFGFQISSPQLTPLTLGMGLVLEGRGPVVLTGHADASWVDDSATQRSSQGYTFSLGAGSVSWRSTRSSLVLSSSCKAEIYAEAMAAQELRWLTYLLTDLGEQSHLPPVLYLDNKAMIALCQEHRLEHRMKHIALRYFLARELQQRGQLRLAYVATRANTADVFTKALPPGDHQRFVTLFGLVPTLPHLLTA
ncbi:unnamed protein product, partial [Closterium sp. NIES-54]